MLSKEPLSKLKLKKTSEVKLIDNMLKHEKGNHSDLVKFLHRKPQKQHQFYSKSTVILKEEDEKYSNFLALMKKYDKIHDQNKSKLIQKKNENKNFLKQYTGYKIYNKMICKDDVAILYGNLLPLYNKKNYFFSNKFLSGKKIFQESGLLLKNKRHLYDFYEKIEANKGKRDLNYLKQLNKLKEDKIENERFKEMEKDSLLLGKYERIEKNYVDIYRRSNEKKRHRYIEGMRALKQFRKNQLEIEKEKLYIQQIKDLIEFEEKEENKKSNITSYNKGLNISETENNSLFILNRYQNNRYNNKINASNTLQKNKSSINFQSSLYKETSNSTNNNNETKQTVFNHNNKTRIKKRNSVNSNFDFSEYTSNDTHTHENKDNNAEYINIIDTTNKKNRLNAFKNINQNTDNDSSTKYQTKYISKRHISSNKFRKNDELSSTSHYDNDKTNNYLLSDYANNSTQKKGGNAHKKPIRSMKTTFDISKFTNKMKEKESQEKMRRFSLMNQNLDMKGKSDLKLNIFRDLYRINNYIYIRNNKGFRNFCENSSELVPKKLADRINKSLEHDEGLKKAHIDYIKLLMEQKIKKYDK